MAKITIDEIEYETEDMSDAAKEQLQNVRFVNSELQRLQAQAAVLQTAKAAYTTALKAALEN